MSEESNHDDLSEEIEDLRRRIDNLNRNFWRLSVLVVLILMIVLVISLSGLSFIALIAIMIFLVAIACLYSLERDGL